MMLVFLGGCDSVFGFTSSTPVDAPPDLGPLEAGVDARSCFGTGLVTVCTTPPPTGTIVLTGALDTSTDLRCAASGTWQGPSQICLVAADQIDVGDVTATGARALVVVAATSLHVNQTLDAASRSNGAIGAGAGLNVTCGGTSPGADAGAAGGSFGGRGASGGPGPVAANGGTSGPAEPSAVLRGGCSGGFGGAEGGRGGGIVVLIAGSLIDVSGVINASGGGGKGGLMTVSSRGGGGGGSGGLIVLDSPTIRISGTVFANGGGGGEGGGAGSAGAAGAESTGGVAPGGNIGTNGGAGGKGGAGMTAPTAGGAPAVTAGGGGGGGAVGVVRAYGTLEGVGVVSPPPSP
ncbi:MAG: hypothetical protein IPQ07_20515 [Myxococcales bacterium]|nr:hypothetical protein [Myxococcales bacterium]